MAIDVNLRQSRRGLLTMLGAAVTGAVAASVAGVERVLAAGSDGQAIKVGGDYPDARTVTSIASSGNQSPTLLALSLSDAGTALAIDSQNGIGIIGSSSTIEAQSAYFLGGVGAIEGQWKWGPGVYGSSGLDAGVVGTGQTGVKGKGETRGGIFIGGHAQIRLVPSTAASHPMNGQSGDLFVDKGHRLWFCLGGTSWKRVQLV